MIVSRRLIKLDRRNDAEGYSLQLILRTVDFSEWRRCFQTFDRILPVFLRDLQAAVSQFGVAVLQQARRQGLDSAYTTVPFRVIDGLSEAIVGRAHNPIGPVTH